MNKKIIVLGILTFIPLSGQDFQWEQNITASGCGISNYLTLGFHSDATDGYDEGFDEYGSHGAPNWDCESRLYWDSERWLTLIFQSTIEERVINLWLNTPEDSTMTVRWDSDALGYLCSTAVLRDPFDGFFIDVDMTQQDSVEIQYPFTYLDLIITPSGTSWPPPPVTAEFGAVPRTGHVPLDVSFTDLSSFGNFDLEISASSGGITAYPLTIGFSSLATDSFDMGLDEYAPPPPPFGFFYPYLLWQDESYFTQIIAPTVEERIWGLILMFNEDNDHISVSWDNSGLAEYGQFILESVAEESTIIDMTEQNYIIITDPDLTLWWIKVTPFGTGSSEIVSWAWEFGDGSSSVEQNPIHTYSIEGSYTVSLTIWNEDGFSDMETKEDYITVSGPNNPPVAVDDFYGANEATTITGNVLDNDYDLDGETLTASLVTDVSNGILNFESDGDFVYEPIEDFSGTDSFVYSITDGFDTDTATVTFTDESTQGDTTIIAWEWHFGDGMTATDQNPEHEYVIEGSFMVSLTVTDANGFSDTIARNQYITVYESDSDPIAEFTAFPTTGDAPHEVFFTDLSIPGWEMGTIISWEWDFGDGSTSIEQNPVHIYTEPGLYDVSLTVTDSVGGMDSEIKYYHILVFENGYMGIALGDLPLYDLIIIVTPFVSEFEVTINVSSGNASRVLTFGFSPEATNYYNEGMDQYAPPSPPSGFDAALVWGGDRYFTKIIASTTDERIFGLDMSPGDGPLILSWLVEGLSELGSFTLEDPFGGVFIDLDMTWESYLPDAEFTADPTSGDAPLEVAFTDSSIAGEDSDIFLWSWDFGDGSSSDEQNPIHTYVEPGVYSVSLTATGDNGWSDTEVKNNYITVTGLGLDDTNPFPKEFTLHQNYPNPFNAVTTISFNIPEDSDVELAVYDINGRTVEKLVAGRVVTGTYNVIWDSKNSPSGIYIYRLTTHQKQITKKMILLK